MLSDYVISGCDESDLLSKRSKHAQCHTFPRFSVGSQKQETFHYIKTTLFVIHIYYNLYAKSAQSACWSSVMFFCTLSCSLHFIWALTTGVFLQYLYSQRRHYAFFFLFPKTVCCARRLYYITGPGLLLHKSWCVPYVWERMWFFTTMIQDENAITARHSSLSAKHNRWHPKAIYHHLISDINP